MTVQSERRAIDATIVSCLHDEAQVIYIGVTDTVKETVVHMVAII